MVSFNHKHIYIYIYIYSSLYIFKELFDLELKIFVFLFSKYVSSIFNVKNINRFLLFQTLFKI